MAQKNELPEGFEELYFQINADILNSFNKFRPPLDIYKFKEDVARIMPYFKVGGRLSKPQVEELASLVDDGVIFFSRKDHPVYVKHIAHQLDLVLMDKNLNETEIADIFQIALTMRMEEFFSQPVKVVFEKVQRDVLVLTEYLWEDPGRVKALTRRMHQDHTQPRHAVNCLFIGLMLFLDGQPDDFRQNPKNRQTLDRCAQGLVLHDIGMSKIPPMILEKTGQLLPDDKMKISKHPLLGQELLYRLDLRMPEIDQCVTQHHERIGGTGYPARLSDIGYFGMLTAVADCFCAMITNRVYAKASDPKQAIGQLAGDQRFEQSMVKGLYKLII